ncbi:hypothetical protein RAH32_16975 [Paracoccus sp. WLY502]|uniref:hypothetical protein n=1 Tax=Paracoccus yibinensis TaxID=3068891 RepID=UPI002796899D|nr:hypothetical protein [Paracoccus sp. WLY502]MDQ1902124.1 hypothetical protein [Paracoccus sp. WLY502]
MRGPTGHLDSVTRDRLPPSDFRPLIAWRASIVSRAEWTSRIANALAADCGVSPA